MMMFCSKIKMLVFLSKTSGKHIWYCYTIFSSRYSKDRVIELLCIVTVSGNKEDFLVHVSVRGYAKKDHLISRADTT